jgi:hypothetical protein
LTNSEVAAYNSFFDSHLIIPMNFLAEHSGISANTLRAWVTKRNFLPNFDPRADFTSRAMSSKLEEQLLLAIEKDYIKPGFFSIIRFSKILHCVHGR